MKNYYSNFCLRLQMILLIDEQVKALKLTQ